MPVIWSPYRWSEYRKRCAGSHINLGKCATLCCTCGSRPGAITSFVDFSARQRQTYGFSLRTRDRPGGTRPVLGSTAGETEALKSETQHMTVKQVSYTFESTLETINHA